MSSAALLSPHVGDLQYDVFADLHLNRFCTFSCRYCYYRGRREKSDPASRGGPIEPLLEGVAMSGRRWLFHITGGEPFQHPRFVDLCARLAENHFVSLNSNLAPPADVEDFCRRVPPERVVLVHASYHVEERERRGLVDDFVAKYRALQEAGFRTLATQVAYPPLLEPLRRAHEQLLAQGIALRPKLYKGRHRLRSYPAAYSDRQREMILSLLAHCQDVEPVDGFHFDRDIEASFIGGYPRYKGVPCRAGRSFVVVHPDGRMVRCLGSNEEMGNLRTGVFRFFEETQPCRMSHCWCPRFGTLFAEGEPTGVV